MHSVRNIRVNYRLYRLLGVAQSGQSPRLGRGLSKVRILPLRPDLLICSSMVEHPAVNRAVVGSSPTISASFDVESASDKADLQENRAVRRNDRIWRFRKPRAFAQICVKVA